MKKKEKFRINANRYRIKCNFGINKTFESEMETNAMRAFASYCYQHMNMLINNV